VPRMRTAAAMTAAVVVLALPATATEAGAQTANDRAEAEMVNTINEVRARHGLYRLRTSDSLMDSAGRYSRWLVANDTFRHLGRIQASGRFAMLGEALAMHTGHRFRVHWTVRRWLGSASHRAILLTQTMRWIGAGVTRGRMGATPATVWVLHTGRLHPPGVDLPELRLP
jgi:uncharacterized protein YkwD